jgi:plasmid stabilization system protein ParE
MVREVIWSFSAQKQLAEVYAYILLDSYQNAEKVKNDILNATSKLAMHPEIFSLDKYRINNDGSFRAFELHRLRISYRLTPSTISITRVRHTKMVPKFY